MSKLRFEISMSLDGFVAGRDQSEENPLGVGGEAAVRRKKSVVRAALVLRMPPCTPAKAEVQTGEAVKALRASGLLPSQEH